ncbi:MAG: YlbF family regulator [Halobacteriaceae archaeon]
MSLEQQSADEAAADVDALARELGEAITDLPVYQEFAEARATVSESEDLQEEISEFEQLRQEFAMARQAGEATEEDLQKVQRAQEDLHSRPKMAAYLDAQERLQDRLETLNEAISEPLAVDFGGEAGGCCQD